MGGRLDSKLVSVTQWLGGKAPDHKPEDLRFKFRFRHKFLYQYLTCMLTTICNNFNINYI